MTDAPRPSTGTPAEGRPPGPGNEPPAEPPAPVAGAQGQPAGADGHGSWAHREERLIPPDLDELAHTTGRAGLRVPGELVAEEPPGRSTVRRIIETALSFSVVAVIFVLVLPAVTGAEYHDVWDELSMLTGAQLAELFVVWLVGMWTYTGVLAASLPGLRRSQGLTMNLAGSAVSNVVPFGGAVGVGATYAMTRSWGFDVPSTTRSILVTGVWNVFAKLGVPAAALVLLLFSGQATAALTTAALVGFVLLGAGLVTFALVLRSDALATTIGQAIERVGTALGRLVHRGPVDGIAGRIVEFRHETAGLVATAWRRLTFWMITYTLAQYLLLLLCVRALGATTDELGWIEVFAAFAFNRLLSTIPLTPSGVGFAETGGVAALVAFGAPQDAAAAAVLLFSGFTYLLEIPLGLVGWGVWATMTSWRRPVDESPAPAG